MDIFDRSGETATLLPSQGRELAGSASALVPKLRLETSHPLRALSNFDRFCRM
jgi:hypothetical protein